MNAATQGNRQGRLDLIPGINAAEDLLRLDGTDWVLTGNMGDAKWQGGGFHLVHRVHRSPIVLVPDFSGPKAAKYPDAAPDAALFSAHGIAVAPLGDRCFEVYAVNHGGRHSIEVFHLDARPDLPVLRWIGGIRMPGDLGANAVTPLPDGGIGATITVNTSDPDALRKAAAGEPCGLTVEWHAGSGWHTVPGSEVSGNNGLLVSPDGAWYYIAAYCEAAVYKLSRGRTPYVRQRMPVGFLVDNLRFAPGGAVLATGHPATTFDQIVHGDHAAAPAWQIPSAVARLDADTLAVSLLLVEQHGHDFGAATSAIVVEHELWLGTVQGQCIATLPLAAIGSPAL